MTNAFARSISKFSHSVFEYSICQRSTHFLGCFGNFPHDFQSLYQNSSDSVISIQSLKENILCLAYELAIACFFKLFPSEWVTIVAMILCCRRRMWNTTNFKIECIHLAATASSQTNQKREEERNILISHWINVIVNWKQSHTRISPFRGIAYRNANIKISIPSNYQETQLEMPCRDQLWPPRRQEEPQKLIENVSLFLWHSASLGTRQ